MDCPACGNRNPEGSRFCLACGAQLAAPAAPAPQAVAPASQVPYATAPAYPTPTAGAVPPQATPGYAGAPPAPRKKRGCAIAAGVLAFLLLCCCGSGAFAVFGVGRLLKPRDLGVRYTQKDYDSATAKLGVDVSKAGPESPTAKLSRAEAAVPPPPGGAAGGAAGGTGSTGGAASGGSAGGVPGGSAGGESGGGMSAATGGSSQAPTVESGPAAGTTVIYEGSVPVDIELTNEEFSALMSLNHYSPNWLVKELQVVFGDGNSLEIAGYVEWEGQRYPFYISGTVELTGTRTVGGSADSLSVAGYDVPAEYHQMAADFLAGMMNDWLAQMPGLSLQSLEISDGKLHVTGTVPASVTRVRAGS